MLKLDLIMLVDDDEATNFFHKLVIEDTKCAKEIVAFTNVDEAITFLKTPIDGEFLKPDIIFLDVNMPGLNGWDFLEAYNQLPESQKESVIVTMLTTSLHPQDQERAVNYFQTQLRHKPLTQDMLLDILKENFSYNEV